MAISTINEVNKPTYKFYSIEKAGYTNMGELVTDLVTDMTKDGKFSIEALRITDENNYQIQTPDWPPRERVVEIVNPGIGYAIGNLFELPLALTPNVKVSVANIDIYTGQVTELKVEWPGNYSVPTVANTLAVFSTSWLPVNSSPIAANTIQNRTAAWEILGNVTLSLGSVPAGGRGPDINNTLTGTLWTNDFGQDGSGTKLNGTPSAQPSPWPTSGIWFRANALAQPGTAGFSNIFVGQAIELDSTAQNNANSVIPPGTIVTSVKPMKYISGPGTPPANGIYGEIESTGTYITVSNQVTLRKNDKVIFKGTGLRLRNSTLRLPKAFRVTTEAQGAVDPINDPLGITAEVRVTKTNSKYLEMINLQTGQNVPWQGEIYEGQTVSSTQINGSIDPGDPVFVSSVTWNNNRTIANVELTRSLSSVPAGEVLQFVFDQNQPWRLCFDVLENNLVSVMNANLVADYTSGRITGKNMSQKEANVLIKERQFTVGSQAVTVYAATEIQLPNDSTIANVWVANANIAANGTVMSVTYDLVDQAGIMGSRPTKPNAQVDVDNPTEGFINRTKRVNLDPRAYPMNYALSMTDRGIFVGIWEGTWSTLQKTKGVGIGGDSYFNWFLVQRPVNRTTGRVYTKGRAPVFCLNSVGYRYWKFIVREEDVLHPSNGDPNNVRYTWDLSGNNGNGAIITGNVSYRVPADTNTQDSFAVINTTNQIALTEDSKYLISFIHNLSSPRFRYSEELDMIGQTSADVCMAGTDITFTAYSESLPRKYRALPANNPYNTGLRIAMLRDIPQVEP